MSSIRPLYQANIWNNTGIFEVQSKGTDGARVPPQEVNNFSSFQCCLKDMYVNLSWSDREGLVICYKIYFFPGFRCAIDKLVLWSTYQELAGWVWAPPWVGGRGSGAPLSSPAVSVWNNDIRSLGIVQAIFHIMKFPYFWWGAFLFVKTIEKVIRLCTALILFFF